MNDAKVHLGFLRDAHHGDLAFELLAFAGDSSALRWLADAFRGLESSPRRAVAFHELPQVVAHDDVRLTAMGGSLRSRVYAQPDGNGRPWFAWEMGLEGWLMAAEIIDPIAESGAGTNDLNPIKNPSEPSIFVFGIEDDEFRWSHDALMRLL